MKIILNGDDYGLRPSIDRSIVELIGAGRMTGAGIMTKRGVTDLDPLLSLSEAGGETICFGLHLDLDDFFPFDETGRYGVSDRDLPEEWQETLNRRRDEIIEDAAAQINFLKTRGAAVTYLDGHHNVHLIISVLRLVLPLMNENGIRCTRFLPAFYSRPDDLAEARSLISEHKIITADRFADLAEIMSGRVVLNPHEPGTTEIMCHTDIEDNTMGRVDQHHFLQGDNFTGFKPVSWNSCLQSTC